jgi:trimeric autotransporter adhesin
VRTALHIRGAGTRLLFDEQDQLFDERIWDVRADFKELTMNSLSDSLGAGNAFFRAKRSATGYGIDSVVFENGNVGIGTDSPLSKLHVLSGSDAIVRLQDSRSGNQWSYIQWDKSDGSRDWVLGRTQGSGDFVLWSAAVNDNVLSVQPDGDVGIGTASPQKILHLKGDNEGLRIEDGSATVYYDIYRDDSDGVLTFDGSQADPFNGYSFKAGGQTFMTIKDSGNVGIGETNPQGFLDIKLDGANKNFIRFTRSNGNELGKIEDVGGHIEFTLHKGGGPGTTAVHLSGGDNEDSYFNSGGNVGIGTDSPSDSLHIVDGAGTLPGLSDSSTSAIFQNNNDASDVARLTMISGSSGDGGIEFGDDGDRDIGLLQYYHSIDSMTFSTNANEQMRIAANGDITGTWGNYHEASDARLKKDVETIPNALDKVLELRGVNFRWKDMNKTQELRMGLIAQEVEEVVPEVVHTADDKMESKAVEYEYLVALLVEGIKEINAENKIQRNEISDLKIQNQKLISEIDEIKKNTMKT